MTDDSSFIILRSLRDLPAISGADWTVSIDQMSATYKPLSLHFSIETLGRYRGPKSIAARLVCPRKHGLDAKTLRQLGLAAIHAFHLTVHMKLDDRLVRLPSKTIH